MDQLAQMEQARVAHINALTQSIQTSRHLLQLTLESGNINQKQYKELLDRIYVDEKKLLIAKGEIPEEKKKKRFRNGLYM